MINKSPFADEIMQGMQRELKTSSSQQSQHNVQQAMEHLRSAAHILQAAGLHSSAQKIQALLTKTAQEHKTHHPHQSLLPLQQLMHAGVSQRDLAEFAKGSPIARAKVLQTLRSMGLSDQRIGEMIGHFNVIPSQEAESLMDPNRSFGKIWEWIQNPHAPATDTAPKAEEQVPEELAFESLPQSGTKEPLEGEELVFKSLAQDLQAAMDEQDSRTVGKNTFKSHLGKQKMHHSEKDPRKVNDPHTKGLTPEKMVKNYATFGVPFNMADDGAFDVDLADGERVDAFHAELHPDWEDEI